ncbi:MAG: BamA/TamA family outer membrane protein [Bdellovibrionales bacterium]|nr:BamA/TamA family outer membrane protein [Bdellovibrionales bacterium]
MSLKREFRILILVLMMGLGRVHAFPIDEIKTDGVSQEQWNQARALTGILPGDEYEKVRVDRAIEKLREFFQNKGYPRCEVKAELLTRNETRRLIFSFELGAPLLLQRVVFESSETSFTPDLEKRLQKILAVKQGELFDRDRIKEMKRSVEVFLTARNFIDSRVKDLKTRDVVEGIELIFGLELGEQVVFSVQGNSYFSRTEVMDMIENQRLTGLGRDFVGVIRNRIRDAYVERGFRNVRITPYFFEASGKEARKVLFEIKEGPQIRIDSIVFDGNETFPDETLERLFFKGAPDRIQARILFSKMLDVAAANLIEELRKQGYLSARLIGIKTDEEPEGKSVKVRIFLNEGLQTRIQSISFAGNQYVRTMELEKALNLSETDPLDPTRLEDGIERIKKLYRDRGHLAFKIKNEEDTLRPVVTYSEKNQIAYLHFEIEEGALYTLDGVDIFGNDFTQKKVIEREIPLLQGDPLSEARLLEVEERLRRIGIFSQVSLELKDVPGSPLRKRLRITVQESVPGNTTAGIGFRNDLGIRAFGGLSYSNLWGLNHTWALDLTVNRRLTLYRFVEYTAQVSYILPWAFAGETTFRPSISAEKRQYIQFDAETFAFSANLERMLHRPWGLSGGLAYALERIQQFNAIDTSQNQQITIGSITPSLKVDLRDNPLAPKRGVFMSSSFEYANRFLGTQIDPIPISYGRFQARSDVLWNFLPDFVWYGSVRGGWLRNFENPFDSSGNLNPQITVPLIKQFALGGINSIRGFTEQEINVQAEDSDRRVSGYLTYINYRTQIDFYPSPQVSIGPFLDAGNLQTDAFSLGNLRFGSGVGLRYVTPVGPVNFDWGFKLFPRPGEATNVFYFSLGVI